MLNCVKHFGRDATGHILAFHGPHAACWPCVVYAWYTRIKTQV